MRIDIFILAVTTSLIALGALACQEKEKAGTTVIKLTIVSTESDEVSSTRWEIEGNADARVISEGNRGESGWTGLVDLSNDNQQGELVFLTVRPSSKTGCVLVNSKSTVEVRISIDGVNFDIQHDGEKQAAKVYTVAKPDS